MALAFVFNMACLLIYFHRGDYYHKQTDQLYYLSEADSLRTTGHIQVLADIGQETPITATSGAAFIMAPFSKYSADVVFAIVSFLYCLLNVSTVFPLYTLLRQNFDLSENLTQEILIFFVCSFPITLLKVMPINETPSLFCVFWFLYFIMEARAWWVIFAFLGPLFRVHIVLCQLCLLIFSGLYRKKRLFLTTIASLFVTLLSAKLYQIFFPYHQLSIGHIWQFKDTANYMGTHIPTAFAYLFIPESVMNFIFKKWSDQAAIFYGVIVLASLAACYFINLKRKKNQSFQVFSLLIVVASIISLTFSTVIISRFLIFAYFWLIAIYIIALHEIGPGWACFKKVGFIGFNFVLLAGFLLGHTTDPLYNQMEDAKKLAAHAEDFPKVFLSPQFPLVGRQVYTYFRRPSGSFQLLQPSGKFIYLSLRDETLPNSLNLCKNSRYDQGTLSLFQVTCR